MPDDNAPKIHRYNAPPHAVGVRLTSQRGTGQIVYLDDHLTYSDHASEAAAFDSTEDAERAIAIVRAGYERSGNPNLRFRWTPEILPISDLRAQARARWQEKRDGRIAAAREAALEAKRTAEREQSALDRMLDRTGAWPGADD